VQTPHQSYMTPPRNQMNNRLKKLKKLINSDFGLPVALLLLAAIVGSMERGFLDMSNGIIAVLLFLGAASFVTSLAVVVSSGSEKKFFVYGLLISAIVVFSASFGLYVNNIEKVIIIALMPGVILGLLIAFLSRR
jgi:hypothetical protein